MKAEIRVEIKHSFIVEIDVSEYSQSNSSEDQAQWLMEIQNDHEALARLCEREGDADVDIVASIKVLK